MSDRKSQIIAPWGVHRLSNIFGDLRTIQMGLPDGRYVTAVCEPYAANRIAAAWWVLTGRAYALIWPEAGELEDLWGGAKANQYHSGMPPTMGPGRGRGSQFRAES
jgi:hypothetical protein